MDKETFIEKCKEFAKKGNCFWEEYNYLYPNTKPPEAWTYCFQTSWISGGVSGGSCWGNDELYSRGSDPETELDSFNDFLTEYFPNITFLQYKKFNKHIKTSDRTVNEYYGNSTEYTRKYINFNDVWDVLVELKLIK